jgi:hypothetical protein
MEAKRKPRHHLSEDSHIIARSEQGPLRHLDDGPGRFAAEPVKDSVSAERRAHSLERRAATKNNENPAPFGRWARRGHARWCVK